MQDLLTRTLGDLQSRVDGMEKEQKMFQSLQLENNKHTDNQLAAQTQVIRMIKTKMDRLDEEVEALLECNEDKGEALDSLKKTLDSMREQMEAHTSLMESLDNLQHSTENNNKTSLEETLQSILKINHENKELIRNIEKKERDTKPYEDNRDKNLREDLVHTLQKQISILHSNFEEMKQKIFNNYNTKGLSQSNIADMKNKVIKSETISKQFFPDMESLVESFKECRDKLTNLEVNFENVKGVSGISNAELENKMTKIIEQLNSLMIKMATLEEKTRQMEISCGDLTCKLSNLESADVFLQEADRMIIEKMSRMEKDVIKDDIMRYVDDSLLTLTKRTNEQWAGLKDQVVKLQTDKLTNVSTDTVGSKGDLVRDNLLQSEDTRTTERNNNLEVWGPAAHGRDTERLWSALQAVYAAFSKFLFHSLY